MTRAQGTEVEEADGPGRAPGSGGSGEKGKEVKEKGLYLDDEDDDGDVVAPAGPPPSEYTVHKGDTLWDLCGRFLGDSWSWPKVWARNPSITNPHWIFPGDRIRFGHDAAGPEPVASGATSKRPLLRITRAGGGSHALLLRTTGFVGQAEMKGASRIVGSREEKAMLSSFDQAYVEFPASHPLRVGERYTIYKLQAPIPHPVKGGVVGHVVHIMGEIRIEQITEGRIARGTILDATDSIERGYLVGPLARQLRPVERRPNREQVEAFVLRMIHLGELIGSTDLVFIDRGKRNGVEEGNLFYVVRRGDGYRPIAERVQHDDGRYPKEVVAELVVVDAREETSVAYVQRSSKELRIGDRLEMRRGY
jgi:hypothetical protein